MSRTKPLKKYTIGQALKVRWNCDNPIEDVVVEDIQWDGNYDEWAYKVHNPITTGTWAIRAHEVEEE